MNCKTILPTNIDEVINALDLTGCERISDVREQIEKIKYFNNALKIDEEFLNLLKDEWGVDFWDEISEIEKRRLIDKSKFYYRKIGTVYAIKEVLKIFDIDTKLKEWFDYEGEPYHFKVILTPITIEYKFDEVMFKRIVNLIDSVKNIRSVLDGFEFELLLNEEIKVYSGVKYKAFISKNMNLDLKPTENLSFTQGAISNVSINSTLSLDLEPITNNTIQGAVIWRV
jgi:phage tail P2-like protein